MKERQAVKIRLKFLNLDVTIKDFRLGEINLEADTVTLRTLLQELTRKSGGRVELIDPQSGAFNEEYIALVNRREFESLPQGLETELNDGDEVDIGLTILTGG